MDSEKFFFFLTNQNKNLHGLPADDFFLWSDVLLTHLKTILTYLLSGRVVGHTADVQGLLTLGQNIGRAVTKGQ